MTKPHGGNWAENIMQEFSLNVFQKSDLFPYLGSDLKIRSTYDFFF